MINGQQDSHVELSLQLKAYTIESKSNPKLVKKSRHKERKGKKEIRS